MSKRMTLPKIGVNMTEAVISKWLVAPGDEIKDGDAIMEAETDKSSQEIYATESGVIKKLLVKEGDTVQCYADIISFEGDDTPDAAPVAAPTKSEPAPAVAPAVKIAIADTKPVPVTAPVPAATGIKKRISPLAKKMARQLGLDIAALSPAAPGLRIVKNDVLRCAEAAKQCAPCAQAGGYLEVIPMSPMRKTIAARMLQSSTEKPCAVLTLTADATALQSLRKKYKARDIKVSVDAILAKVVARALSEHMEINSVLEDGNICIKREINVGVAVDTPRGLTVPVVTDTDKKNLCEISSEIIALASAAKDFKLAGEKMTGGTFTITNLGMYEIEQFTPVINPPECCILAAGAVKRVFVPDANDQPVARDTMQLTLVFDHRIVDGGPAARFLRDVKRYVEDPMLLV